MSGCSCELRAVSSAAHSSASMRLWTSCCCSCGSPSSAISMKASRAGRSTGAITVSERASPSADRQRADVLERGLLGARPAARSCGAPGGDSSWVSSRRLGLVEQRVELLQVDAERRDQRRLQLAVRDLEVLAVPAASPARSSSAVSSADGAPGYSPGVRSSYSRRRIFVTARASSCRWSASSALTSNRGSSARWPHDRWTSSRRDVEVVREPDRVVVDVVASRVELIRACKRAVQPDLVRAGRLVHHPRAVGNVAVRGVERARGGVGLEHPQVRLVVAGGVQRSVRGADQRAADTAPHAVGRDVQRGDHRRSSPRT